MSEAQQGTDAGTKAFQPTVADEVTAPSMAPVTDDASGQAEDSGDDRPNSEEEVAAQLEDFA